MATNAPRAVIVTRETDYQALIARHATRDQARFFLSTRGQDIDELQSRHERFQAALHRVRAAVPLDWRSSQVGRGDLDRFLFGPEDIVVAVGQDGLVANLAKYLEGQPVLGINPEPALNPGILVPLPPEAAGDLLLSAARGRAAIESRTMAEAALDDGQTLCALNEIFVGHRSHQSARYRLRHSEQEEEQSSSGIVVSTGTGATGWAKSIMRSRRIELELGPTERRLAYFVREPWPSGATATSLSAGTLDPDDRLEVLSHMHSGGVIFADGIEQDHLDFDWGKRAEVHVAGRRLNLVQG
jgi:NAD kinase